MKTKSIYNLLITSFVAAGMCGCCDETSPIPEVLYAYLEQQQEQKVTTDGYCAYFDLSDGMLSAYSDPITKDNLKSIVNKITGNVTCEQVYALKNGMIEKLEKSQTELYNYILNSRSYAQMAPIEETLKQIVSDNKSAFLVTDFEEYTNGSIQHQNYAKKYFVEWLNKGFDISFFVMDYTEGKKSKHLYFTVFNSTNRTLFNDIESALDGKKEANYKRFNLTTDLITFDYNYAAATRGGSYHDANTFEDIVSCTNETGKGNCYTIYKDFKSEFYPFEATWTDIVANAKSMSEEGNTPVFTHLITGPVADFSLMSGYKVEKIDIRTCNIQNDFNKFTGYYEFCKSGTNADEEGKVLLEFDYNKAGGTISEVADLFTYSGKINNGKASVNIDFRPGFSGEIANMPANDLLRVDVVIAECRPKYNVIDELFAWDGNNSLADAVRNTLQEVNPQGNSIYTFFICALQ